MSESSEKLLDSVEMPHRWPLTLWTAALLLAAGSFLSGWHTAVLNTTFAADEPGSLLNQISLSAVEKEAATALTVAGAAIGSSLSVLPSTLGYKRTILMNNLLFLGGTLCTLFPVLSLLLVGRFVVGLAVGFNNITSPVLLSEIAPKEVRGLFTTMHQLGVTIGILASGVAGLGFVSYVPQGWRYLFAIGLICPALQFALGWAYIPESPRWLVRNGRRDAAILSVTSLRPMSYDVRQEIDDMDKSAAAEAALQEGVTWSSLLNVENRKALTIGVGMLMYSCFSGINVVIMYSTEIFGFAGVHSPLLSTVLVFGLNVIMTVVVTFAVDKAGRVAFLLGGSGTMIASLGGLGLTLLVLPSSATQGWLAVLCVLLYVAGFAVSFGGVGFTLLSEVVPTSIRPKAFTVALTANFVGNLALSLSVLSIIDVVGGGDAPDQRKKGVAILFLFFAAVVVTAFVFIYFYVPETKGRSLEEIAQIMGTAPEAHLTMHNEATANSSNSPGGSSLPGYQDSEQAPLVHRNKATSGV